MSFTSYGLKVALQCSLASSSRVAASPLSYLLRPFHIRRAVFSSEKAFSKPQFSGGTYQARKGISHPRKLPGRALCTLMVIYLGRTYFPSCQIPLLLFSKFFLLCLRLGSKREIKTLLGFPSNMNIYVHDSI